VSYRLYGRGVEEMGTALLRSESGVIGTVEAGYTFAAMSGGDHEWRVAAANAYLIDRGSTLQVATLDDGHRETAEVPDGGARYDRFAGDTLARLQAGQPPVATLEDCYRAMRVVDEIYRVAERV
jgi:predicted dehydrogenase